METNETKKGLSPGVIVLILVLGGLLVAGSIMAAILITRQARVNDVDAMSQIDEIEREVLAEMTIPEFTLTDQTGASVGRSVFEGQWTVLEFMFTSCVTACPTMKGNLVTAQQEMRDLPVQYVSITVDPEHDTPEFLSTYAKRYGLPDDKWRFLTGDLETITAICEGGLGFGITMDDDQQITRSDGRTMSNILHPSRFFIVSPEVKIVGMYDGLARDDTLQIARDLRRMIRTGLY